MLLLFLLEHSGTLISRYDRMSAPGRKHRGREACFSQQILPQHPPDRRHLQLKRQRWKVQPGNRFIVQTSFPLGSFLFWMGMGTGPN